MNKLILFLTVGVLLTGALAGCSSKKNDGGDGGTVGSSNVDESAIYGSAIADNGYRVAGSVSGPGVALATGGNASAANISVVDQDPSTESDAAGALDKADFLIETHEADGTSMQAELRSMTTARDAGVTGDFMGGVANNVQVNGNTGNGSSELPEVKAFIVMNGLARVKYNGTTLPDLQLVQVYVTRGIRGSDGAVLTEADTKDLEFHVIFPGTLLPGNAAFPGVADGFLYFYFENVKLKQLTPDEQATVGSKLTQPEKTNIPPVANAQLRYANGTMVSGSAIWDYDPHKPNTFNLTLDASNSTDPDGSIEAYSWTIQELNSTGFLRNVNKTTGAQATIPFDHAGQKRIDLRVIDDRGGIGNMTVYIFIEYHIKSTGEAYGTGVPVGGGQSCTQGSNCGINYISVEYGATKLLVKEPTTSSGQCVQAAKFDIIDPKSKQVAAGKSVDTTVTPPDLSALGKWSIQVYFSAVYTCVYNFEAFVYYSPQAKA